MPDWRREVSRKVREYGEKKKILTTPPNPLKESSDSGAEADVHPVETPPPASASLQAQRAKIITAALARVEPPEPPDSPLPPVSVTPAGPPPDPEPPLPLDPPPAPIARFSAAVETSPPPVFSGPSMERAPLYHENEIMAGDLDTSITLEDFQEEAAENEPKVPVYLGRRTGAAIIDHTMLVLLHAGLLYICAEIMNLRFWSFLSEAWLPVAGIFLLFHCLYFLYFYKTSRQTPGMVFFGIELRDPFSGYIPTGRILGRWMAFVFLNVFNFVPLLMGRDYLVLDALSGTQIRTLK